MMNYYLFLMTVTSEIINDVLTLSARGPSLDIYVKYNCHRIHKIGTQMK